MCKIYIIHIFIFIIWYCVFHTKKSPTPTAPPKTTKNPLFRGAFQRPFSQVGHFLVNDVKLLFMTSWKMTPHLRESAKWPFYLIIELLWTPCCSHTTAHFYGSQWKKVVNFSSYFRSYKTHRCTHNHVHEHILRTMYVVFRHTHTYCKSLINLWSS